MSNYQHDLEEKFAEILDHFAIEYEYEPTMFVLGRNGDGDITKGFTPDFYLPELEIYVEITSMNGSACSRKRRKIELLKEMHDIDAILLKRPEINHLISKFQHGDLHLDDLCGTLAI